MNKRTEHFIVVSGVTFAVFFTEALIHYNYGITETKNLPFKWENFVMPKGKSLVKMATLVVVASVISGVIIDKVSHKKIRNSARILFSNLMKKILVISFFKTFYCGFCMSIKFMIIIIFSCKM